MTSELWLLRDKLVLKVQELEILEIPNSKIECSEDNPTKGMKTWYEVQKELISTKDASRRRIEFVHAKKSSNMKKTTAIGTKGNSGKAGKPDLSDGIYTFEAVKAWMKWREVRRAGPGMYNHGNTCFLNSTLQCLVHIPPLAQIFQNDPKAISGLTRTDGHNAAITILFKKLVNEVWSPSPGRAISPRAMVNSIRRVGKQFRNCRQEDAHEYLRELVNCMHEESMKAHGLKLSHGAAAETTVMSRVFGGYLCNVLKCLKCKYTSRTFNHFQDLSVDVTHGIRSVSDAIAAFVKPEKLCHGNEWHCDGCKRKVPAIKQMTISSAPMVLVLHLKRFAFGGMSDKINRHIEFQPHLSIPVANTKDEDANGRSDNGQKIVKYSLCGVLVHHGHSVHSGHYVAYVKASNDQWYEMDDSSVSHTSLKTVLKQQAYILFYIQIVDPPPVSEAVITSAPPTAPQKAMQLQPIEQKIIPTSSKILYQDIDINEELAALEPDPMKRFEYIQMMQHKQNEQTKSVEPCKVVQTSDGDDSSESNVSSDISSVDIRLKRKHAWQIGAVRFEGPLKKFCKWRTPKHPVPIRLLCAALLDETVQNVTLSNDDIVESQDKTRRLAKGGVGVLRANIQKTERASNSFVSKSAVGEEDGNVSSVSFSGSDTESDGIPDSRSDNGSEVEESEQDVNRAVSSAPQIPSKSSADIRQELIKLSMRGRDTGGEGVWEGERGEVIVSKDTLVEIEKKEKKIRREEGKDLAKKRASQWDQMLDAGRQKKIKTVKNDIEQYKGANQFQQFQDTVAASGGFSTHFSQKWQADNARKQEERQARNADDDWHEAYEDKPADGDMPDRRGEDDVLSRFGAFSRGGGNKGGKGRFGRDEGRSRRDSGRGRDGQGDGHGGRRGGSGFGGRWGGRGGSGFGDRGGGRGGRGFGGRGGRGFGGRGAGRGGSGFGDRGGGRGGSEFGGRGGGRGRSRGGDRGR